MKDQKTFPIFFLDRPEAANALDLPTARKLKSTLDQASKDHSGGLIITSRSSKIFCAGGDLKAYAAMKTKAQGIQANRAIRKILQSLKTAPMLVVAAIEGEAIGGGCELALACDWIITGATARFAFKQVGQNLIPGWGGGKKLFQRVKPSTALDWLTSGRHIDATEAFRAGLSDEMTLRGQALTQAQDWLHQRTLEPDLIRSFKSMALGGNGADEEKIFEKLWFGKKHRLVLRRRN